jgi:hypothetical protein
VIWPRNLFHLQKEAGFQLTISLKQLFLRPLHRRAGRPEAEEVILTSFWSLVVTTA